MPETRPLNLQNYYSPNIGHEPTIYWFNLNKLRYKYLPYNISL